MFHVGPPGRYNRQVPLTRIQCAHYVLEVQDLTTSLLRRLDELEVAAANWVEGDSASGRHRKGLELNLDEFKRALGRMTLSQSTFFDALEGFLAGWVRLSLLFFPVGGDAFRQERGEKLRQELGIARDSVLSDRDLRNSWMHFDERLDSMIAAGIFQDRQRFISSQRAADFVGKAPRLMEVDTQRVHYLSEQGKTLSVDLADLRRVIEELDVVAQEWWHRPV